MVALPLLPPKGAVGVSSDPVAPASPCAEEQGALGATTHADGRRRRAGSASGEMRGATDPREEPCIRARAGGRRRPFVAPVARRQQSARCEAAALARYSGVRGERPAVRPEAPEVLHRPGGRAAVAVRVGVVGGVPEEESRIVRADLGFCKQRGRSPARLLSGRSRAWPVGEASIMVGATLRRLVTYTG